MIEIELHPAEITEEMTMAIQDTIFEMTQKMTVRRRTTGSKILYANLTVEICEERAN